MPIRERHKKPVKCWKRRYKSEIDAKIVLAELVTLDRPEKRAYYCKNCRGWHLTKEDKRTKPNLEEL